jgi:hypothetical protein
MVGRQMNDVWVTIWKETAVVNRDTISEFYWGGEGVWRNPGKTSDKRTNFLTKIRAAYLPSTGSEQRFCIKTVSHYLTSSIFCHGNTSVNYVTDIYSLTLGHSCSKSRKNIFFCYEKFRQQLTIVVDVCHSETGSSSSRVVTYFKKRRTHTHAHTRTHASILQTEPQKLCVRRN